MHNMDIQLDLQAIQSKSRSLRVAILMGCYNGADHLQAQLDSIAAQTHTNWVLLASDDGSSDETLAILQGFRQRVGENRVHIRPGPGKGFLANFLTMACDPAFEADFFAFSDQDDLWEPVRLERALTLVSPSDTTAALYCSRTHLIDDLDRGVGYSPAFRREPCFRNALVQSIAGGNTMVFNEAARRLLCATGGHVEVASHDWWLYLLVSGAGGRVVYDEWPSVRYRQHDGNLVGGNIGWRARFNRLGRLLEGRFGSWNRMHCEALAAHTELLTPENRAIFELFRRAREERLPARLGGILRARVFRQTSMGNLGLYAAVLLNKF